MITDETILEISDRLGIAATEVVSIYAEAIAGIATLSTLNE